MMNEVQNCAVSDDTCGSSAWKPPKFDLRFWIVVAGLMAVWTVLASVQNWASLAVIAVVMLTWLFGCPRTKRATLWVAPAILAPFAWLVLTDYPWNDYRWMWIGMWGHGLGILPAKLLAESGLYPDRHVWAVLIASMITTLVFLTCVSLIRFWPRTRWWVLATVLALSALTSLLCYRGFGM